MGDKVQLEYGREHLPRRAKSVLEIGSKDYGNTTSFREVYPEAKYVGVDISPGAGVDVVLDLERSTGKLGKFDVVICCSVLEHTPRPWRMAKNINKLVADNGHLYISVPWVQRWHPYPNDYWRISHEGIKALFPGFDWKYPCLTTFPDGEIIPFTPGADNIRCITQDGKKFMPYFHFNMIGLKR